MQDAEYTSNPVKAWIMARNKENTMMDAVSFSANTV